MIGYMAESIAKNTVFMTVASVLQKVISSVYFFLLAHQLEIEGVGKYVFALSFTSMFVVLVDCGLTNILIREASKVRNRLESYLHTILSGKIFLGSISYAAVIIVINALGYPAETKVLVYLSGVTMLFDSLHLTLYGALRSLGNLKYEAIGMVGSQALTFVLGSVFLFFHLPLIFFILAFTISSLLNLLAAAYIISHKHKLSLIPKWNQGHFFELLKMAIPFAFAAIFARVYSSVDALFLSLYLGDRAVGWYSLPAKIVSAFQFIPLALIAALYPKFSTYFVKDKAQLANTFELAIKYVLLLSVPIAVGIGLLASDIIHVFKSSYAPAILPLQILVFSLIFSYISFPIGAILNACNRQTTQTVLLGIIMIVNIFLNILYIPLFGIVGSAIAALVCNIILAVAGYIVTIKVIAFSHRFMICTVLQVGFAGSIMGGVVWWLARVTDKLLLTIVVGVVIYSLGLLVSRAVTLRQLIDATHLFSLRSSL